MNDSNQIGLVIFNLLFFSCLLLKIKRTKTVVATAYKLTGSWQLAQTNEAIFRAHPLSTN